MKKKWLIILFILGIAVLGGVYYSYSIQIKGYDNNNFKISYDSTWKVIEKKESLVLEHKKSKGIVKVQCKILDTNYINTPLSDLISDIINSVEEQNKGYELISSANITDKYEAYSFLYENNMKQALVNVYKKDNKLIIAFYEANSEYFDIGLDSVDTMFNTLEIMTGEKVN